MKLSDQVEMNKLRLEVESLKVHAAGLRADRDRLLRWKEEATEVIKRWETVNTAALKAGMPTPALGRVKSDCVREWIEAGRA